MVSSAPYSTTSCTGSLPTGAVLGYDNERRMTNWQSAPSNPGATAGYAYDGEGHRVAQSVTAGGSTTTTYYVAGLEEQANTGGTSTLTKYYAVPGVLSAVNVGGTLSVLASDGLGSVSEALTSTSAAATSQQLYGPYGGLRYATGNMPTAKGYIGQYADAASSGLDYYGARYYDPLVGQFTSADSQADGLNRYGYVAGNPETATDPSGHRICDGGDGCGGGDDGGDDQCRHGCGGGGGSHGHGGKPKAKRKGWNGCYEDDVVCQGDHAKNDAQDLFDKLTELLKDKFGEWFQEFVDSYLNPLTVAVDLGRTKFFELLAGNSAEFVQGLVQRDANDAIKFYELVLAWGAGLFEVHQTAAWFRNPDNIAAFGHFVQDEESTTSLVGLGALGLSAFEEDPGILAIAFGLMEGSEGWQMLDDGILVQLFEFDPFPPGAGGKPISVH